MRSGEERSDIIHCGDCGEDNSDRSDIDSGRTFRELLQYFRHEIIAYTKVAQMKIEAELVRKSQKSITFSVGAVTHNPTFSPFL